MAYTPKRRKLDKVTVASPPASNTQKFYCCRCPTAYCRQKGFFPVSHSPMYRSSGYLPWCNDCIEDIYQDYLNKLKDEREVMRRMCMKMDLYWSDDIYDMVAKTSGTHSRIRNYIGKTNMIRYIDKTFDDTLKEEALRDEVKKVAYILDGGDANADDGEEPVVIEQSVIDFWGAGYTPDFYDELEKHYKEWTGGADIVAPSERSLYRQICLLEVIINRDAADGKPIKDNVNALNNLLGSMNLKPAQQKSDADADLEKMPLGVGIQKWEYSRPLPETPKEKKDIRGTIKNITTWYLGHLCKMTGVPNSYCKMYEEEMEKLRVKNPENADEDDDTLLTNLFGDASDGDGQ